MCLKSRSILPENIIIRGIILLLAGLSLLLLIAPRLISENIQPKTQAGLAALGLVIGVLAVLCAIFQARLVRSLAEVMQDARQQRQALSAYQVSRIDLMMLTGLMASGFVLRGLFITQPIRTDEAVTYLHYASRSLPLALSNYSAPNNHLLHTLLVWISVHLFGNTEIALRLPAFVMGVLLIPVTYGVGRTLANRRTGLLAAALVAVSSVLIEYSTNARGYTLQCALFGVSIILAFSVRSSLSPTRWGLLALTLALGFFTVPTTLYPFGGLMLWLLGEIVLSGKMVDAMGDDMRLQRLRAWVVCGLLTVGLTLVFYTPVLIVSGVTAIISNQYVQSFPFDVFLQHVPAAAAHVWTHWHTSIPPVMAALLSVGAVIGLMRGQRTHTPLFLACALWSMAALCLQRVIPFERNWLPFLPLYFMTAAGGLVWLWERWAQRQAWVGWLLASFLIIVLGANIILTRSPYTSLETGTFRDAQAIVQDLQGLLKSGDHVYLEHPNGDSLAYYANQRGLEWEVYIGDTPTTGTVYLILNTEYPQTIESVARWNGIPLDRYAPVLIRTYPQGALVRLEPK